MHIETVKTTPTQLEKRGSKIVKKTKLQTLEQKENPRNKSYNETEKHTKTKLHNVYVLQSERYRRQVKKNDEKKEMIAIR